MDTQIGLNVLQTQQNTKRQHTICDVIFIFDIETRGILSMGSAIDRWR